MSEFLNNLPTAAVSAGFPIAQLDDLFANNAILTDERVRMAQDVRALRSGLSSKADPWARDRHGRLGACGKIAPSTQFG